MNYTASGLILDIAGVVLIFAATSRAGVGYLSMYRPISRGATGTRYALWAKRGGWLLLGVGFFLQLVGEFIASG